MDVAYVFTLCGPHPVTLWLHTAQDPPDDAWNRAMDETEVALRHAQNLGGECKSLVVSDGGSPTLRQRTRLSQTFNYRPHQLSVVTTAVSNPVKRGVATAMRWFNPSLRVYQPHEMREALIQLELIEHWPDIKSLFEQLQEKLPRVRALELAFRSMG